MTLSIGVIEPGPSPAHGMPLIIKVNVQTANDEINRNLKLVTLFYFLNNLYIRTMMPLPFVI